MTVATSDTFAYEAFKSILSLRDTWISGEEGLPAQTPGRGSSSESSPHPSCSHKGNLTAHPHWGGFMAAVGLSLRVTGNPGGGPHLQPYSYTLEQVLTFPRSSLHRSPNSSHCWVPPPAIFGYETKSELKKWGWSIPAGFSPQVNASSLRTLPLKGSCLQPGQTSQEELPPTPSSRPFWKGNPEDGG